MVLMIPVRVYLQDLWTPAILSQWWHSQQQQKFHLSLTVGLQVSLRKLYDINEGQRVAIQLLKQPSATKNLPRASGCSKIWKHGRADAHIPLLTLQAVLWFSVLYRGMVTKEKVQQQWVYESGPAKKFKFWGFVALWTVTPVQEAQYLTTRLTEM